MKTTTWYHRTIKNGTVKINGKIYRPEERHLRYDGRLDGLRYMFGLYHYMEPPSVALWGTSEYAKCKLCRSGADHYATHAQPECVDGALVWYLWTTES